MVTLSHIGAAPATCTIPRVRGSRAAAAKFAKASALRADSSGMKLHQFGEPVLRHNRRLLINPANPALAERAE